MAYGNWAFRRFEGLALPAALALLLAAAPANAAACPGERIVKSAAASFVSAARSGSPEAFSAAIGRFADVRALALYALGPYRSALPPSRQAEYLGKAKVFMGRFLARHSSRFGTSPHLEIESCRGGLIQSSAGGSEVVWRVSNGRVRDVRAGGVWLAVQLRTKFVNVIRRGGGDIEALFDFLERRS
jgi:phospholipid transport system substrate-binding protein